MTPEQRRRLDRLLDIDYSLSEVYSMIDSLVAAEVEKEREACAKIADDHHMAGTAAAIRARSEP